MISHLIPYEKPYINITVDVEEASDILMALKQIKQEVPVIEKLQELLKAGLTKAISYQNNKDSKK